MKISIVSPNDWNIKKFIIFVITFLLAFIGLTLTNSLISNEIFLLIHQIFTSLFLLFVPGFIILRILRIHQINLLESLIFTVGLSISSIMIVGLCLNTVLPLFGLNEPLREFNLISSIILFILFSTLFAYISDKDFMANSLPKYKSEIPMNQLLFLLNLPTLGAIGAICLNNYELNIVSLVFFIISSLPKYKSEIPMNQLLFLLNLPTLGAIGAICLNNYELNIVSLVFFIIISLVPLVVIRKFKPSLYSVAIFMVSLAILYNKSLVSMYIT